MASIHLDTVSVWFQFALTRLAGIAICHASDGPITSTPVELQQVMRVIVFLFLSLAQLMWPIHVRAEPELEMRANIERAASKAFRERNFDMLERTANEFRTTKARTSSGLWKLTLFYSGISRGISESTGKNPSRFDEVEDIVAEWTRKYPKSPSAWISHSVVLKSRGWAYRGEGYANTVSAEAWKPFYSYIGRAREVLEKNKEVAAIDPKWYEEMLIIAAVQSWEQSNFVALVNEALQREPYFYQTYFSALEYLLPKWGGNVAEVEQFALASVGLTSTREGKGMYARIYWYASQSQFGNAIFQSSVAKWTSMRDGFDDVIDRYPDAWNMNNYAKFSCLAGDVGKLRELLKRVENDALMAAWGSRKLYLQCKELASVAR